MKFKFLGSSSQNFKLGGTGNSLISCHPVSEGWDGGGADDAFFFLDPHKTAIFCASTKSDTVHGLTQSQGTDTAVRPPQLWVPKCWVTLQYLKKRNWTSLSANLFCWVRSNFEMLGDPLIVSGLITPTHNKPVQSTLFTVATRVYTAFHPAESWLFAFLKDRKPRKSCI